MREAAWLFPRLLKIMAVMGGGKTVRAVTGLRTESANGMCELLSWSLSRLFRCLADASLAAAHRRRQCGEAAEAFPATAENPGGYGMSVKRCGREQVCGEKYQRDAASYFRGRGELLASPFGGCIAGSGARQTTMRCGGGGVPRDC